MRAWGMLFFEASVDDGNDCSGGGGWGHKAFVVISALRQSTL